MQSRAHDIEFDDEEVEEPLTEALQKALEEIKSSALKQKIETLVLENDSESIRHVLQTSARPWLDQNEPKISHALLGKAIQDAVDKGGPDILSLLLESGGKVSEVETRNLPQRPVHTTIAILEVLLEHGWDINGESDHIPTTYDFGQTTLCILVRSFELVKWMLEHGADPNSRSYRDRTPMEYAAFYSTPEVAKLMISYGGDLKHSNAFQRAMSNTKWRSMAGLLLEKGCDINAYSHWFNPNHRRLTAYDRGYTPLQWATKSPPQLDKLRWLLEHGADPHAKDYKGSTAYDFAVWCGVRDPMEIMLQYAAPDDPFRNEPACLKALQQDSMEEDRARDPDLYPDTSDESEGSE
ncbi:MAG: hypothetical protein M1820_004335 [Bogoriella megaspora]|nr:MAG: hypothetical protein M1820_004335 [Bogoriella megaspora]